MKTVVFIGHNECYNLSEEKLNSAIINCVNSGVTNFLSGGQGRFDRICARKIFDLKNFYPNIKNSLVIPYPTFNVFNKQLFDEIILPDGFEKFHYKAAIPERNKYMVRNSDIAICYITHDWGNAVKTYTFAIKNNLQIITL